ncbi:MAG: thiamine pyrophosphate-dependent enzyme [Litorimonas sp.]
MQNDRAQVVHENFLTRVKAGDFPALETLSLDDSGLTKHDLTDLYHVQLLSRHLDRTARKLQKRGQAFYTIGSSGHENTAAIARALRPTDMAFLHYRDAAFQLSRARQVSQISGEQTPLWDMLLSFSTAVEDPISGGRHKVLGSKSLFIPPQTSTIASHLPKAVGAAFSLAIAKQVKPEHQQLPCDAIIACSFGDASLNHSTTQGALNTASWAAYQGSQLPILFICEDNGIGISTKTPSGWVEQSISNRPAIKYFTCNGLDVLDTYRAARAASHYIRTHRRPAFLHMKCVRLYGHAGPDVQTAYLSKDEITNTESRDPLLHTAAHLIASDVLPQEAVLNMYERTASRVERVAEQVIKRPRLKTADDVMASIIPARRGNKPIKQKSKTARKVVFGASDMRAMSQPQHMAKLINFALTDLMLSHDEIVMAGEDIGKKGGVYGVTQRLQPRFGRHRVIDTLLDEQSILGLSTGMAHNGFIPMPEIQFLAYLHNAIDQLRGEAATLPFFSNGQYTNPMVVRIAGLGYQRGFGGHFHNENSLAALRDIPGLILACPSNGEDAVLMLRECVRLAREEQRLVVFLEPIALYMQRDLHNEGDNGNLYDYPMPDEDKSIAFGEVGTHGNGSDLAIITYGNGVYLSRQAQKILADSHDIKSTVIDLRWLSPLPQESLLKILKNKNNILIVDECREQASHSEALMALLTEEGFKASRLAAKDSFIATGPSYGATMPSRDTIIEAALKEVAS